MNDKDWVVAAIVLIAAVAVAYVLGRRQRGAGEASRREDRQAPRATGEKSAASAKETKQKEKEVEATLQRLDYEEDHEIDPTRVGASTPPRQVYQPPLKQIVFDEGADGEEPPRSGSLFLVHATAQTDTGLRRKRNEDSLLVEEKGGLFVIADGMGGYRGGELASQLTVETIGEAFRTNTFEGPTHDGVAQDATNLARAIQMANAGILEIASRKKELEGMGTTVCAARFSAGKRRLYIGHVGDSRCYRLRKDVLKQMTADHTMADHGVKGPESAHLSRAVGIWPTVPIDIVMATPETGDVYLLCSDGLTKMLRDETIASVIRNDEDPKVAVERLIFFANAKGGKDNITIILVRVVTANWKPRPSHPDLPPPEEPEAREAGPES